MMPKSVSKVFYPGHNIDRKIKVCEYARLFGIVGRDQASRFARIRKEVHQLTFNIIEWTPSAA